MQRAQAPFDGFIATGLKAALQERLMQCILVKPIRASEATLANSDEECGRREYRNPMPGMQICQVWITGQDQVRMSRLGQCQKHVVLGVDAIRDRRVDLHDNRPSTKPYQEILPLPWRRIAVELCAARNCLQLGEGFLADAHIEIEQGLLQRQGRDGGRANRGALQNTRV